MLNEAYLLSLQPAVLEAVLEAVLDTDRLNVDIQNALQKAQILLNRVVITLLRNIYYLLTNSINV